MALDIFLFLKNNCLVFQNAVKNIKAAYKKNQYEANTRTIKGKEGSCSGQRFL